MNRLTAWIKTVVIGHRKSLTDEQLAGDACVLCGHRFLTYRSPFGWIGLPFRLRAWACETSCIITAVDDVEALFRSAIPARQHVDFWSLGVCDMQTVTDENGFDQLDEEWAAALDAQPRATVEIVHAGGVLTTRPLPREYAGYVAVQAQKLGFTAMVNEAVTVR